MEPSNQPVKISCLTFRKNRNVFLSVKQYYDDREDVKISCPECDFDNLNSVVLKEWEQGTEVFISSGANLGVFLENFEYPVIAVELEFLDYYDCFLRAEKSAKTFALATYRSFQQDFLPEIEKMLGIKIIHLQFDTQDDLRFKMENTNFDVIIGGGLVQEIASEIGKKSLFLFPGVDTVKKTLESAIIMAKGIRKEQQKIQVNRAFFEVLPNGVVEINNEGFILNYNPAFKKILNTDEFNLRNRPIQEILPEYEVHFDTEEHYEQENQIIKHMGKTLHLTITPLYSFGKRLMGALIVIVEGSKIVQAELEYNIRNQVALVKKGLKARYRFTDIVGKSQTITSAKELALKYAETDYHIMIRGETGSGKELFAQSIHNSSCRRENCFVAVNCGALPETLLESELFGYSEGAFTGSRRGGKIGLFELADGGTIFLDEVGDISPKLQVQLLRVLQEKEVMRIGDNCVRTVDVRVITATNKSIHEMLSQNYRQDLLYRMNVLPLEIPPLRDRGKDIVLLFRMMIKTEGEKAGIFSDYSEEVYDILNQYSWPGNVRELENVSKRFISLSMRTTRAMPNKTVRSLLCRCIGTEQIIEDLLKQYPFDEENPKIFWEAVDKIKSTCDVSDEKLAGYLGISRSTLWRRMKVFQTDYL